MASVYDKVAKEIMVLKDRCLAVSEMDRLAALGRIDVLSVSLQKSELA